jgi:type III secretory pathway component EscT
VSSEQALWSLLTTLLTGMGVSLPHVLLAWGRVLPLVLIVPAFGSRLMPAPARAVFGLGLAILLLPAMPQVSASRAAWFVQFVRELARGLPIGLTSAAMIWAAMMAGGMTDDLRGAGQHQNSILPDAKTPTAAFLGLFAVLAFLQLGGVSSAVAALANESGPLLLRAVSDLVHSINIAFSLVAPLVCVSVIGEVSSALIARAASPAYVQSLLSPLRSVLLLGGLALMSSPLLDLVAQVVGGRAVR